MSNRIPANRMGIGNYTNSSPTAARRWMTEIRQKVAASTRKVTITGGQTLQAPVNTILMNVAQSVSGAVAAATRASLIWFTSFNGLTPAGGTFLVKEATVTTAKACKLHIVTFGVPANKRVGA